MGRMTKRLEEAVAQARELPEEEQDELAEMLFALMSIDEAGYALAPEQVEEVKQIQEDLRTGKTRLATDEEVAEMWKKFGA
jgi:hypothetical protein